MLLNSLLSSQANTLIERIEYWLNIDTHISSATFPSSSSTLSYEVAGFYSFIILSSAAARMASLTTLLCSTNWIASRLVCP